MVYVALEVIPPGSLNKLKRILCKHLSKLVVKCNTKLHIKYHNSQYPDFTKIGNHVFFRIL